MSLYRHSTAKPIATQVRRNMRSWESWLLSAILLGVLMLHVIGVRRDLPYVPEIDEPVFVQPAVQMAAQATLNPKWFGNPGSTTIYPLALAYRIDQVIRERGPLLGPDPRIAERFTNDPARFYLIGRGLSVAYSLISVLLVYLLGRRVFDSGVALAGAALTGVLPIIVDHAQMVRTDTAALCFGTLALWLSFQALDRPTLGRHALAGLAIGLAIASRYFMVALLSAPLLCSVVLLWRARREGGAVQVVAGATVTVLMAMVGFFAATPYFLLDFATAQASLQYEARSSHPGADGLSFTGNLWWYLREAFPTNLTPLVALAALGGIVLVLRQRRVEPLVLLGVTVVFMIGLCLSPLHWHRWTIQILPICALFAVVAVMRLAAIAGKWQKPAAVVLIALLCAWPLAQTTLASIRLAQGSTRILARTWLIENLPAGSRVVQEAYGPPLAGTALEVQDVGVLGNRASPDQYASEGFDYAIASSGMYWRFEKYPERYPEQAGFYQALFAQGQLVHEFAPSLLRGGPTIRVYALQQAQARQ